MFRTVFGLIAVAAVFADDSCPDAKDISPCTCDGEGVNCFKAKDISQIRKAFRANFKYGGTRAIWIQNTDISSIPKDLFNDILCPEYYLEVNKISKFDWTAVNSSRVILTVLSLFGNKIDDFDFKSVSGFPKMRALNLGSNMLSSIPNNALNSLSITDVILARNNIHDIGSDAFRELPNLKRLDLSFNKVTTLGPLSLALKAPAAQVFLQNNQIVKFHGTSFLGTTLTLLYLAENKIESFPENPFSVLFDAMSKVGGVTVVSGNPLTCKGCDYRWIVQKKQSLLNSFWGFVCRDGRVLEQLFISNIGC